MTFSPNLTYVLEKVNDRVKGRNKYHTFNIGDLNPSIKIV